MIESMKKIEILLYHREREEFLNTLRDAGVVHIESSEQNSSAKAEELNNLLQRIDKAKSQLRRVEEPLEGETREASELIDRIFEISARSEALLNERANLHKDQKTLEPWGDFSHETQAILRDKGVYFTFFEVKKKSLSLLEGLSYEVIHQTGSFDFVIVFSEGQLAEVPGLEPLVLPTLSLSEVEQELSHLEKEEKELHDELAKIAGIEEKIDAYKLDLSNDLLMEQARNSLAGVTEQKVLHMTGWFPKAKETAVVDVVESFSCWYETDEPQDGDTIPVKLKNRGGFKLFEPLTKMFSLPDYYEIDPTPFIAPFFAFFFGLCLGDLGYGLIIVIGALIALFKVPEKMKPAVKLVLILGLMTAAGGFILNTFFGMTIFKGDDASLLGQMAFLKVEEGSSVFPAMAFAVYLGFTQIILGNILRSVNTFKNDGFKYMLPNIATLCLIVAAFLKLVASDFLDMGTFAISSLKLGELIASAPAIVSNVIGGIGLVLMLFFNNPRKKLGWNLGMFIIAMYNFATGLLSDSLSYIRLFALGLAGGLLGFAFNQLALSFITVEGVVNWASPMAILTILVMVLGHALNFFLALIGSFVHPLRLTFVEFYGNLDFKGGSVPFKPFTKNLEN